MRVLQVHKFFYPHAGSETVLFHTRDLLRNRGHEVLDFAMEDLRNARSTESEFFAPTRDYNDLSQSKLSRGRAALATVYSIPARRRLADLLDERRPDVAHLHLISHQLTFSVVDELYKRGIPTVMTLHDYKIGCPAYVLYRDGKPCRACVTGPVENVLIHKCLKGSRAASGVAAVEARLARLRGSWHKIDQYIGPSGFAARVAVDSGIPQSQVQVLPNFLPDTETRTPVKDLVSEPRFFMASRLEAVKGVKQVLQAFEGDDPPPGVLVIAGAGGDLEPTVQAAAHRSSNVEYLGRVSRSDIVRELRMARAALVPSLWDENNPMSLLEARAAGIPVIATRVGGLPEMVDHGRDGLLVEPGDVEDLTRAMRELAADRDKSSDMGRNGYDRLRVENSASRHYERLMEIYADAARHRAHRT